MSFLQFEDMSGSAEIIAFPKTFARAEKWLSSHHVFIIKGSIDATEGASCKIKAQDIIPIELALSEWPNIEHIAITIPTDITEESIISLKKSLTKGTTPLQLIFQENNKTLRLTTKEKILIDTESAQLLEQQNITIQCAL
jgi:DNA polymerase-3 subunit alpha